MKLICPTHAEAYEDTASCRWCEPVVSEAAPVEPEAVKLKAPPWFSFDEDEEIDGEEMAAFAHAVAKCAREMLEKKRKTP